MAYAHSKLMGAPIPLLSGEMDFRCNRPVMIATKTRALSLQVRNQQQQNLQTQKAVSVSRRDAMLYVTAEIFLSGLTLLAAEAAEARTGKLERKRKIMEKLEKLREEAGVSKPKTEKGMTPPIPPPRPMNPQQRSVRPPVEATLP